MGKHRSPANTGRWWFMGRIFHRKKSFYIIRLRDIRYNEKLRFC